MSAENKPPATPEGIQSLLELARDLGALVITAGGVVLEDVVNAFKDGANAVQDTFPSIFRNH